VCQGGGTKNSTIQHGGMPATVPFTTVGPTVAAASSASRLKGQRTSLRPLSTICDQQQQFGGHKPKYGRRHTINGRRGRARFASYKKSCKAPVALLPYKDLRRQDLLPGPHGPLAHGQEDLPAPGLARPEDFGRVQQVVEVRHRRSRRGPLAMGNMISCDFGTSRNPNLKSATAMCSMDGCFCLVCSFDYMIIVIFFFKEQRSKFCEREHSNGTVAFGWLSTKFGRNTFRYTFKEHYHQQVWGIPFTQVPLYTKHWLECVPFASPAGG
jgi:hypothetical protein